MKPRAESTKVLIVEPHPYHQEILPGFVKYFHDIGYDVDCYVRRECKHSHVFCQMPQKPNILYYNYKKLPLLLSDCSKYDYVFFSSFEFMDKKFQGKIPDFLGYVPNARHGIMGCHHTISNIKDYNSDEFFKQNRIFSCSGFKYKNKIVPMLAPIYYGDFEQHELNVKKQFIVVGAVTNYSKNHNLLFETVEKLLKNEMDNFQIIVIGKGRLQIPRKLRNYIKFKGALSFDKMFKYINNSDFYLPLLDLNMENHLRYLTNCCTGSRNLILGFRKPCLINDVFAAAYRFDPTNAVLYKNNDLYTAMKIAVNMTKDDYNKMKQNVEYLAQDIYSESLNNLRKVMGK